MKKIKDLTPEECQGLLDKLFKDVKATFKRIVEFDTYPGMEYVIEIKEKKLLNEQTNTIYFDDPDLITLLYENNIDIKEPLDKFKFEFLQLDELNSTFFEHIISTVKILDDDKENDSWKVEKMKQLRKKLAGEL